MKIKRIFTHTFFTSTLTFVAILFISLALLVIGTRYTLYDADVASDCAEADAC